MFCQGYYTNVERRDLPSHCNVIGVFLVKKRLQRKERLD